MAYTTIDDPSEYFTTTLYTGNGSDAHSITNSANSGNFKPDWLWTKNRTGTARNNSIFDSSRGVQKYLYTNQTDAEATASVSLQSFDTNGFTVGTSTQVNPNGNSMVSWQWKANGGAATATISESGNNPAAVVQANATAGFSIISYTGTGSSGTMAHGLGAIPKMYIVKNRDSTSNFEVFTSVITSGENSVLRIDNTDAKADSGVTLPTSTNITVTSGVNQNQDGQKYIMYCFKSIQGYSKMGSYVGNGNANGAFVHLGFKPAWVMLKRTDSAASWLIFDNKRDIDNVVSHRVYANATDAEDSDTGSAIDFLSNGFKCRSSDSSTNTSSGTYIYMAFAESPFVSSKGVPTTAR